MEFVEGRTLARLVCEGGPLDPVRACGYVRQAALALQHAHERDMTHRDVKPQNLILTGDGGAEVVKLLDFGLAKLGPPSPAGDGVTLDGEFLGTPGYAAPEQVRNPSAADIRADIYSLGVTLLFLLTGNHPLPNSAPDAGWGPNRGRWPRALAGVVARMTAWDPADRYQTPAEVARALDGLTFPVPGPTSRRRRPLLAALGLAAVLLGGVAYVWVNRPHTPPPVASPETPPAAPVARPFVRLFNGTDLSGWVVDGGPPDQWRAEDGAIATTGLRNGPRTWLLSACEFGDVRVRFEYQMEAGGNSGLAFRAAPGERPVLVANGKPTPGPYHQQVELLDDACSEWAKFPTGQVHGGLTQNAPCVKPLRPAPLKPPGEWNAVEFELIGQTLKLTVNGAEVQNTNLDDLLARGSLYPALTRPCGRIGFQQMAKTVRFRNIEVQDLSPESR
ncbi:MAG: DUF1080 domain-containing protein, partial [Gemmataceae bacterium]|nr:DUF1080 domain-containing protein [Gemmataceae bacterium]